MGRFSSRPCRLTVTALLCVGIWGLCAVPLAKGSGLGDYLPGWVKDKLADFEEDDDAGAERVNAAGRGSDAGPLSMPLIDASVRQSMVAGTRPFHLAWSGGRPPFKVQITGPSGEVGAAWQPAGKRAVVATISLVEGHYEAQLTDAGGQSVLAGFDVVAQAPAVNGEMVEALPADQQPVVLAARLAVMDDGAWQLEAYEQLAAIPDSQAAAITARRLAAGRSIAELATTEPQ